MKRLLLFISLVISLTSQAQYRYLSTEGETAYARGAIRTGGGLFFTTGGLPVVPTHLQNIPGLVVAGESVYRWSTATKTWVDIGAFTGAWGSITGNIAAQTDLATALTAKQNLLPLGTSAQYRRGDHSVGDFTTDVTAAARTAFSAGTGININNGVISSSDTGDRYIASLFVAGARYKSLYGVYNDGTYTPVASWEDLMDSTGTSGGTGAVSSVFGRTGDVLPQSADYFSFYATKNHTHNFSELLNRPTTLGGYGIIDAVPSARTITINGITQDLTQNRTWAIATGTGTTADGSETKVTAGQNITVTGTGTTLDPYIINAFDTSGNTPAYDTTDIRVFSADFSGTGGTPITSYIPEIGNFSLTSGTSTITSDGKLSMTQGATFEIPLDSTVKDKKISTSFTLAAGNTSAVFFHAPNLRYVGVNIGEDFGNPLDRIDIIISKREGDVETIVDTTIGQANQTPLNVTVTLINDKIQVFFDNSPSPVVEYDVSDYDFYYTRVVAPDNSTGPLVLDYFHVDNLSVIQGGAASANNYITGLIHTIDPTAKTLVTTATRSGLAPIVSNTITLPSGGDGGAINVLDYGADPTGVANSTTAINNAITAAAAAGFKEVKIPAGTYKVNTITWNPNVKITGAGMNATKLVSLTAVPMFQHLNTATVTHAANAVTDIGFYGNNIGTIGVDLRGVFNFLWTNVRIDGFTQVGLQLKAVISATFNNPIIINNAVGIYCEAVTQSTVGYQQPNFNFFNGGAINANSQWAVDIVGAAHVNFNNVDFELNGTAGNLNTGVIRGSGFSSTSEGQGFVVNGSWFERNNGTAVYLDAAAGQVRHVIQNTLIQYPQVGTSRGIYINQTTGQAQTLSLLNSTVRGHTNDIITNGSFSSVYVSKMSVVDNHSETNGGTYEVESGAGYAGGDIEITDNTKGVVMKDANGVRWRLQPSTTGTSIWTNLGTVPATPFFNATFTGAAGPLSGYTPENGTIASIINTPMLDGAGGMIADGVNEGFTVGPTADQENVLITFTFGSSFPANNGYRLEINGSQALVILDADYNGSTTIYTLKKYEVSVGSEVVLQQVSFAGSPAGLTGTLKREGNTVTATLGGQTASGSIAGMTLEVGFRCFATSNLGGSSTLSSYKIENL